MENKHIQIYIVSNIRTLTGVSISSDGGPYSNKSPYSPIHHVAT